MHSRNFILTLILSLSAVSVLSLLLPQNPTSQTLAQPLSNNTALATLPHTQTFKVPNTRTTLTFSDHGSLLSSTETDLCVIEGLASTLSAILGNKRGDGFLPRNGFAQRYGTVEIAVQDFAPPLFRLTWSVVANMLRGIALWMSMFGWFEVTVGVFDAGSGHVGAGRVVRVGMKEVEE